MRDNQIAGVYMLVNNHDSMRGFPLISTGNWMLMIDGIHCFLRRDVEYLIPIEIAKKHPNRFHVKGCNRWWFEKENIVYEYQKKIKKHTSQEKLTDSQ